MDAALDAREGSGGTEAQRRWTEALFGDEGGALVERLLAANSQLLAGRRDPGRDLRLLALGLLGGAPLAAVAVRSR